ncbi:hypothetical protein GL218_03691 [Daldinia childiae]|uniref:uncharacterized protein n=1 Tax=Daldinia childiae TaxID=326645 RepID=UPI0014483EC7|nr:uncharacterized protein GL218_03691 [Daldinia childiae]KAF3061582.1 hypothetical protein GL218_03691 [Daldinia childiae]
MSGHSYAINQHGNIGLVQAVHYGDNVFYGNTDRPLTLKHVALETHKKVKSEWEEYRTCDWLLRENDFQLWEKLDREVSFLWIHGRPGCGKSTLMSRVIESIYHQFMEQGPETIHLLYFYVGFGDDQEKDTLYRKMLMTFWEQATNESNQQSINTFGNHSTIELIENKLHKFLTFSKRNVYLVIDALDQLPLDSQYQILNGLTALAQKLRNETDGSRLSVAISSRDCNGIDQLKTYRVFPIEVTAGRNKRDIEIYLQKCLESKSKLFQKRPDLGEKVFNHLSAKADGM